MEEKVCGNCKNYIQHYVIHKAHLLETHGHCAKHKPNRNTIKLIDKKQQSCEKWECAENEKTKREESIIKTLREIKRQLTDVALILKAENDPNTPH